MSDPEHDNSNLIPFLKTIDEAGSDGLPTMDTDDLWEPLLEGSGFVGASKIRQSMYISKTAVKKNDALFLTEKGKSLIGGQSDE